MVAPDIEITVELAHALLREQHPDLADHRIRIVANGWDNTVLRLGDDLALRLPRREVAGPLVRNEQRWLPELAPSLPVPVPVPVRVGEPSHALGYPWAWSVVPWREGTRLVDLPLAARQAMAASLAAFHRALHLPAPADAPRNPVRGVPLSTRADAFACRLEGGRVPEPDRLRALFETCVAAPEWSGPPLWVHGDTHAGNLLATLDGGLAVLDFGDITAGDPATDLAAAWLVFDAAGRSAYRGALADLHPPHDPIWIRAFGWALNMATATFESTDADAWIIRMGQDALAQLCAEALA